MKLLRRKLDKIEQARAVGASRPMALVWTSDNQRVGEDVQLGPGEHIATDVHVLEQHDFFKGETPSSYRIVERVTKNPDDNGGVFDLAGLPIGRVYPTDPPYLDLELFEDPPSAA